jgi:hypothetical protein
MKESILEASFQRQREMKTSGNFYYTNTAMGN